MIARNARRVRAVPLAAALYLFAALLVGFAIDGGVASVLSNLYLLRLGYGPASIGLVNAAGTITFALASLPAGALGERWGAQRSLVAGMALMTLGSATLPLADLLAPAWRLGWLIATIVLLYAGLACFFVNGPPFLMRVVPPERRAGAFSAQVAVLAIAGFAGSLLGGLMPARVAAALGTTTADPAAYRFPLLIAALALAPGIWAIMAARPPAEPLAPASETPTADAPPPGLPSAGRSILALLLLMALTRLLQVAGLATTNTFFNVYLDDALEVPTAQIGAIAAVGRLLSAPAALFAPLLCRRLGSHAAVAISSVGTAALMLPLALVPHWGAAALGFVGVATLSAIRYAASLVFFLDLVPPNRRTTVTGVTETAAGLSFAALTFGGGYLVVGAGYTALFLLGAGVTLLGAIVFVAVFPRTRPDAEASG
jgi:MFS family permease